MIPSVFDYKRASSVEEALNLLGEDVQILGGGHSLIPALKLRLNNPMTLVDISKIETIKSINDNGPLADHCPMMVEAAREIGDIQVRNMGTIGGSMAHADPAADWPAVLLATDANVMIQSKEGKRTVDIDQFFTGFYETALQESEIITGISVPKTAFNKNSTYVKFKQPASRFAIVGVAAAIEMDGSNVKIARIGITGVAEYAYRAMNVEKALAGKPLTAETINEAVVDVGHDVEIMSDHYATSNYREHLAHVFVKRALMKLI